MARDDDRGTGTRRLPQGVVEFVTGGRVEAGVGLVEQPQLRSAGHQARKGGPALLACRELAHGDVDEPVDHPEALHGGVCFGVARTDGGAPEPDVLTDGHVEVEPVLMTENAHVATDLLTLGDQVEAEHRSGAAHHGHQARTEAQECGLAGAVGSTEQHDVALVDADRRTRERRERSEHGDGLAEFHDGRGGRAVHAATLGRKSLTTAIASRRSAASFAVVSDVAEPPTKPARVRKFDRPPPPRDWRWWVGGIGKTLIAAGLLMFGFVAYQLWGTGIETARAQNALENEFEELLSTAPPVTTVAPLDSTPTAVDDPEASVPAATPDPPEPEPEPAAAPVVVPVEEGDPIARIEMPSIGVDNIVVAGVAKSDLKKGPGHYPETPMPGQLGNAAIAGHRTTYGQPFFNVDKLEVGDEITVTTLAGRFVYRVTGQQIVGPDDYHVVATTDPTVATITLTSCHPKYTARERIIISGELDEAASSAPVADAVLNYGRPFDGAGDTIADPTNTVVDSSVPSSVPPSDPDPVVEEDPTIGQAAAVGDAPEAPGDADAEAVSAGIADAFSDGWFSDPGANSQVALWGLLLAAIGALSYLVSRKAKRDWVGLTVGIVPFLVVLYFFFQNVNRLLPPNL